MKMICLLISIFMLITNVTIAHAADTITESPKIRIVIEGEQISFSTAPITINYRTMLPLRELLTRLGVQNDDRHIVWNNFEQSVTAYKDSTKIYLKVGEKTAFVNDSPIELQAAPVNYRDHVFIPLRFVSDSLGKTVVWDEPTNTALIRETEEFKKTKEILDKVKTASSEVKKYRFSTNINTVIASNDFEMKGQGETDLKHAAMHVSMGVKVSGKETVMETYLVNNALYSKTSVDSAWQKKALAKEQSEKLLGSQKILDSRSEVLAAGLVLQQGGASDDIVMKGDVFLDDVLKQSAEAISVFGIEFNKMTLELSIDRNSSLLKGMTANMESAVQTKSSSEPITQKIICLYSDYDENFEIKLPDDVIKNAVDSETGKTLKFQ